MLKEYSVFFRNIDRHVRDRYDFIDPIQSHSCVFADAWGVFTRVLTKAKKHTGHDGPKLF